MIRMSLKLAGARCLIRISRCLLDIGGAIVDPELGTNFVPTEPKPVESSNRQAAAAFRQSLHSATVDGATPMVVYGFQVKPGVGAILGFDTSPIRAMEELQRIRAEINADPDEDDAPPQSWLYAFDVASVTADILCSLLNGDISPADGLLRNGRMVKLIS